MTNINFLWSKGLYERNNYMLDKTEKISSEEIIINEIKNCKKYLWIRNTSNNFQKNKKKTDLDIFADNINLINNPIILITSDGDRPVPSSYDKTTVDKILNSNKVIKWFTQNYDETVITDKIDYLPIGLDLHTTRWLINNSINDKINYFNEIHLSNIEYIKNKIFCDSHLTTTHNERVIMYKILKENKNIDFLGKSLPFQEITKKYRSYKFVLSPRGAGIDCHRSWELFLLGCIIITKTSSLDSMWIKHKLPVVILNDWSDLNTNLQDNLQKWYDLYNKYTEKEYILNKFNYDYWLI
jgi:hypothetical protein